MTVTTENNKVEENGDGIKTIFEFNFVLRENSHLQVYKYNIDTQVSVLQVETVDYIIPVPAIGQIGGSVEYTVAPAAGERSILIREIPFTQETSLPYNGNLPAKVLEQTYDNNTMICQQLNERLNRTFKSPIGTNPDDLDFTLPAFKAKKAFIVNDAGTEIIMSEDDYADQLANVTAKADEADTSATNAATSASNAASSATSADAARVLAVNSATDAANSANASSVSAGNSDTARIASQAARDASEGFRDEAEGFRDEAETAKDDIIELFDQFPDLTPTDTGKIATVNDDGTGYDLIPSGTSGYVLTSNGNDAKPTYQPLSSSTPVIDNLTSTSATDALSANQGRILKSFTDTNSANISANTGNIATNTTNISNNTSNLGALAGDVSDAENDITNITTRVDSAESNIVTNTQNISTNASNIAVNSAAVAKLPVTNPTDTGRLAVVNPTGDAYQLLAPGNVGQVLTSAGPNAIPTFQNDSGGTVIIDDLLSTSAVDALSANQGRVLKAITDTNANAITSNTNLINRIPPTVTQDTGKLLAVDPTGAEFNLLSTGTAGQVLTSGGLNTLPTFQDPSSGGEGFKINRIEITSNYTLTMDAFDNDIDIVLIEAFTDIDITIDVSSSKFYDLIGKSIIIQVMDNNPKEVAFSGSPTVTGYRTGAYFASGYTRSILTLLTNTTQTNKVVHVDDQHSLTQITQNTNELALYSGNPISNKGHLMAAREDGSSWDALPTQGNAGEVLTSRGAGLLPSFQPAGGSGSMELISSIEASGQSFMDFVLPTDDANAVFKIVVSNIAPSTSLQPFFIRFSNNGGSSFLTSNYGYTFLSCRSDGGAVFDTGSLSEAYIRCSYYSVNSVGYLSSEITLFGAGVLEETNITCDTIIAVNETSTGLRYRIISEGHLRSKIICDAVRFYLNTGTFGQGTISLYRIKS